MKKINLIGMMMVFFLSFSTVLAQPHEVLVRFWSDRNRENAYCDEIMKVYFQNRTYVSGQWDYNYTCYHADYHNCIANVTVEETRRYDLLITDGNIVWDVNGCPLTNENYEYWSTVQSGLLINEDKEFDYYINVTYQGSPRQFFWGTISWGAFISALYFIATFAIIFGVEWWIVKQKQPPSGVLAIVIFIIMIIIKLILGI